jgi:N-acetylmuramoyl-L-alanine amidase
MAPLPFRHALQRSASRLFLCLALVVTRPPAHARISTPYTAFDGAERMREALEARPRQARTAGDYERVMDAYRAIYRNDPTNPHADAAVDAVAALLADEGRVLRERKLLLDAVGQYGYLRRRYPASRFRQNALLSQAEIEASDLHDNTEADKAFEEFLSLYPHSPMAGEARQQLRALHRGAPPGNARAEQAAENAREHARELAELNSMGTAATPTRNSGAEVRTTSRSLPRPESSGTVGDAAVAITGIRHWSTPIYTRVAIDLSGEVSYEAARVPNPDRIYFDLHGARLTPELVGKSVDVTDDGYLRRVRAAPYASGATRIVLDVSHVSEYSAFLLPNPWRLIIDIHGAVANGAVLYGSNATPGQDVSSLGHEPTRVRATHHPTTAPIAATVSGTTRAPQPNELEDLASNAPVHATPAPTAPPTRRITSTASGKHSATVPVTPPPATENSGGHEAIPTSTGERSLVRALGLKIGRIVIDAGHGGHDSGTVGPDGIEEKDVVLDVSLRLGRLLKQRLGADVVYTRDDDAFIPLETRTAIANKAQADLFISVHANSSPDATARGVEVYYLNFTTSPEALEVAARENAVSNQSIYQLSDLVKKITLKDKIDESHEFASDVESSLYSGLEEGNAGLKDRGVKKAPFVVLIGANMPSILAEISFLTNPDDARQLRDPAYRERIAESLYRGVSRYVSGLSGVRVAQNGHAP